MLDTNHINAMFKDTCYFCPKRITTDVVESLSFSKKLFVFSLERLKFTDKESFKKMSKKVTQIDNVDCLDFSGEKFYDREVIICQVIVFTKTIFVGNNITIAERHQ